MNRPNAHGGRDSIADYCESRGEHLPPPAAIARFWSKVDRRGADECWTWTGYRCGTGHGVFSLAYRVNVKAHRFSFWVASGRIPQRLVCHKCDNAWCVNPSHLEEGTARKNVRDRIERGHVKPWKRPPRQRDVSLPGSLNPHARLTEDVIPMIRRLGREGMTGPQIVEALRLPVGVDAVYHVLSGRGWSHVPDDDLPATLVPASEAP